MKINSAILCTVLCFVPEVFAQEALNLGIDDVTVVSVNSELDAHTFGHDSIPFQICNIVIGGRFAPEYWITVPTANLAAAQNQGASIPNPRQKLHKNLSPEARRPFVTPDGKILVLLKVYDVFDPSDIESKLQALGLNVLDSWGRLSWQVLLKVGEIDGVANLPWVEHLEAGPFKPIQHGLAGRVATGAEVIQGYDAVAKSYDLSGKIDGDEEEFIKIAIADGGIRPHEDLHTEIEIDRRYRCLCHPFYDAGAVNPSIPTPEGCNNYEACGWDPHAQRIAAIALGDGVTTSATPTIGHRGQAPEARYGDYPAYSGKQEIYNIVVSDGSDLVIHPQSTPSMRTYGVDAALVDNFIAGAFGYARLPQIWSAGNCDHVGEDIEKNPVTQSKNALVTSVFPFTACDGGAYGPTIGGQVKPDLVVDIINAEHFPTYGEINLYTNAKMQSSEAAASVGGLIALLLDKIAEDLPQRNYVFPSTTKAILVNTASDVGAVGPDHITGFGAVNGVTARDLINLENEQPGHFIFEAQIEHGFQEHRYCLTDEASGGPLRVTLAWDDRGSCHGTTIRFPSLFNDLDMEVRQSNNVIALPMTPHSDPLVAAVEQKDSVNNVERIETSVSSADLEETEIVVSSGRDFMIEGQDYSLVSNQPLEDCSLDLPHLVVSAALIPLDAVCDQIEGICDPCPGGPIGTDELCPAFDLRFMEIGTGREIELVDGSSQVLTRSNRTRLRVPPRTRGQPVYLRSSLPAELRLR